MKKVSILLVLMVLVGIAQAQDVRFGLKAGVNRTGYKGKDLDSRAEVQVRFYAGSFVEFAISKRFAIRSEVVYSLQGSKIILVDTVSRANDNYINIPVLAQFNIAKGFSLVTGPQVGILVSSRFISNSTNFGFKFDESTQNFYNDTEFGWVFGGAYELPNGLAVEARYNLGLTKLDIYDKAETQNSVLQIGLAYAF